MMLLRLFWEFFKIGLFAVGGGMATIPFLYDLSDRTGWFTYTQLADMIAISESTPGPIGVNMATYVGYEMSGVLGSISTTLGFVAPSIIIIVIVSIFLQKFRNNRYVESAFYGLRPASSGLIASAALSVAIVALLAPVLEKLGIPPETAILMVVRPVSGSGALAAASDIIGTYGPDSRIGRTAAVMLGSTETTFYVLAVYFGACGVRRSRWAIPAAIAADLTGFLVAAALVRWIWGT